MSSINWWRLSVGGLTPWLPDLARNLPDLVGRDVEQRVALRLVGHVEDQRVLALVLTTDLDGHPSIQRVHRLGLDPAEAVHDADEFPEPRPRDPEQCSCRHFGIDATASQSRNDQVRLKTSRTAVVDGGASNNDSRARLDRERLLCI